MLLELLNTRAERDEPRQSRWIERGCGEWFGAVMVLVESVREDETRRMRMRIWHKGREELLSIGKGMEHHFGPMLIRPVALRLAEGLPVAVLVDVLDWSTVNYGAA